MNVPYKVPLAVSTDGTVVNLGVLEPRNIELGVNVGVYTIAGEHYHGSYEVTPRAYTAITLETAGLVMDENVRVLKVPYHANNNLFGGKTAYIAEELENNGN